MSHNDRKHYREWQKAQQEANKLGLTRIERHIFMCVPRKAKCATASEIEESWRFLKKRLKQLGLRSKVFRSKVDCFDICHAGPIVVVYPEGTWYGRCTPEVLETIIEQHLLRGQPVEQYVLARRPLS